MKRIKKSDMVYIPEALIYRIKFAAQFSHPKLNVLRK